MKCKLCENEYHKQSGAFTLHLNNCHGITLEEYIIITKYNNIPPKCACGLCNEIPNFNRGEFKTYYKNHNKFKIRENLYIKKFGEPKCMRCDNIVGFHRGIPNKYCSYKCLPNRWNQEKVKRTLMKNHGVSNPMYIPGVVEKIHSKIDRKEQIRKSQITKKSRYKNGAFDPDKMKATMLKKYGVSSYSKTKEFRILASKTVINTMKSGKMFKIKKYKDTSLTYQSSYELDFLELCESQGILGKIKNGSRFKFENGKYFLNDFGLDQYEIEIKSNYWFKQQGGQEYIKKRKNIVESHGKKYLFILDKEYKDFLKILNNLIIKNRLL